MPFVKFLCSEPFLKKTEVQFEFNVESDLSCIYIWTEVKFVLQLLVQITYQFSPTPTDPLKYSGNPMCHTYNINSLYILQALCPYGFPVILSTKSDGFPQED